MRDTLIEKSMAETYSFTCEIDNDRFGRTHLHIEDDDVGASRKIGKTVGYELGETR